MVTIDSEKEIVLTGHFIFPPWEKFGGKSAILEIHKKKKDKGRCARIVPCLCLRMT